MICNICPRKCGVDRNKIQGFCGVGEKIKISRAALHFYEEPCISGESGSGTVFFSGCNLKCVYCQNKAISGGFGKEITINRLVEIFIELQEKGANNINLVTPDHYALQIKSAIIKAKEKGLKIPIVYNTSGYCDVDTIKSLQGVVDIFLTDLKYVSSALSKKYSSCENYFLVASKALKQMFLQTGKPCYDKNGIMQKGIIVRHLCLPENADDSKRVIEYVYNEYQDDVILSIMNQYTPMGECKISELNRKLTDEEYQEIVDFAVELGVENAFVQEGETADESFIPDFETLEGV